MAASRSQLRRFAVEVEGKTVKSMEWSAPDPNNPEDAAGGYWVMTFAGGGELSFLTMAEITQRGG